jgi:hypothetical protein
MPLLSLLSLLSSHYYALFYLFYLLSLSFSHSRFFGIACFASIYFFPEIVVGILHAEVPADAFARHIPMDLPDPVRMRQLLVYCIQRQLDTLSSADDDFVQQGGTCYVFHRLFCHILRLSILSVDVYCFSLNYF